MALQNADTTTVQGAAIAEEAVAVHHSGQPTPAQVLSWLPKGATPAQQDSAIRANIKIQPPTYSSRPDTLGTPFTRPDLDTFTLSKPQWHGKSLVQKDSVYKPEVIAWRQGVGGDPVPYSIAGDNVVTSMLLGCFVIAMVAIAQSKQFILRQAKNFFYVPRSKTTEISETSNELRFQFFLMLQTCLLFSLIFFYAVHDFAGQTFVIDQYLVIGAFTGIIAAYFLVKILAYWLVGWVFFDKKNTLQWIKAFLFLVATEGVLIYPLAMFMAYFDLESESAVIYASIVLLLSKLLCFYKTYIIFFHQKGVFLQNILYFCALEIVPGIALWGVLVMACSYLKINF